MTPTKTLEHRIIRDMMHVREDFRGMPATRVAEMVIRLAAATAVVALLAIQLPELLWAGVAASAVYALGLR